MVSFCFWVWKIRIGWALWRASQAWGSRCSPKTLNWKWAYPHVRRQKSSHLVRHLSTRTYAAGCGLSSSARRLFGKSLNVPGVMGYEMEVCWGEREISSDTHVWKIIFLRTPTHFLKITCLRRFFLHRGKLAKLNFDTGTCEMKFFTLAHKKFMYFLKRGNFLSIFWLSIAFNGKYCRADLHYEKRNTACDLLASGWGSDKVHSNREQNKC